MHRISFAANTLCPPPHPVVKGLNKLYIFIVEPGGPPQGLATTALSSTSVKVEWLEIDPALQFGIILSYKIKYQRTDKKDALKETISLSTTAVLSDLNEYTDYDISVAGSTSKGAGIFSTIITQKTLEDRK